MTWLKWLLIRSLTWGSFIAMFCLMVAVVDDPLLRVMAAISVATATVGMIDSLFEFFSESLNGGDTEGP